MTDRRSPAASEPDAILARLEANAQALHRLQERLDTLIRSCEHLLDQRRGVAMGELKLALTPRQPFYAVSTLTRD